MNGDLSSSPTVAIPTRERILDAAAAVIHERGLARATTKEIARQAGYSEALLYKYFADKQEIYLGVLRERIGALSNPAQLVGVGDARENLVAITVQLMRFYVKSFPMSASIFSDRELLKSWRAGMSAKGAGPEGPLRNLEGYIEAEVAAKRVTIADPRSAAALLCGAAFQHAFLACFHGLNAVPDDEQFAASLVASVSQTL